ncbi:MAG: glycosyl hydrolase [Parabacteroides sp.]|nr:glycosyl hydrolase [Parabacteroides sp.]
METYKMIRHLSCILASGLLMFAASTVLSGQTTVKGTFSSIQTAFANPPAEYRTAPFMVWNGKVTKAEIDRMIKDFKDAGCGAAFIHPRPGMITEYMSDDWYSLYQYAVQKGKEAGLTIWIYDENSYPSGFAGGHVPHDMPESYNQGQGLELTKVDKLPENINEYFICLKKGGNKWIDITSNASTYKDAKGEYYLYKKTYLGKSDWYGGYSYVDLLAPGVTQQFIKTTMKGYEQTLKSEFGTSVLGIFTDEPNISSPGGLRWSPDLFSVFKQQWGYDLKPLLPLLGEETANWKEVRHNYMETLLQMFIDRWSKPWSEYCVSNNLKWTGHYWEHGWPQMNDGPDNMAMYAWHQMPAIDMLFNQFDEKSPNAQFGNIRSVKELRSVANQMGYVRTLSETYGGGGWDESFKDFKRLGDWEYVLGVNFMNQHLAHMTLTGARKYDYPPVFTYVSPWWKDYKEINDYFGRLSMLMSMGAQKNHILILEPNSTLWSYYSHTGSSPKLMEIGNKFQDFITTLEKAQVEYDLGSENVIKDHGRVSKNGFNVGKVSYDMVIIPPLMETLNKPTFDLLQRFVAQGGKIVAFSEPTMIDGKDSNNLSQLLARSSVVKLSELSAEVIDKYFHDDDFVIDFNHGDLYHQRRKMGDGEMITLVNSSMKEAVEGSLSVNGKILMKLDAQTGKIYVYPSTVKAGKLTVSFKVEPAGSLILYALKTNPKMACPKLPPQAGDKKLTASTKTVVKRLKDNALTIDFCDVTVKGETHENVYFSNAANIAYKAYGFPNGNPWNTSVQYKRNIVDRDTFREGGFTATYHFKVNEAFNYSGMRMVSERPELFTVKINGTVVKPIPGEWWLDRSFGVYNVERLVKEGENTVEVSVSPMSVYAEIEPIYITGNFSVVPEPVGWSISAPVMSFVLGSWKDQKQPFYSWDMSYSKSYTITKKEGPYAVQLNKWNGTVAEVYINGAKAGIIYSNPYRLDISSLLKSGLNQVEVRIIGSLRNLIGPHYRDPSPGLASPDLWKRIDKPIPASQYLMKDYGLMEDFDLVH